MNDTHHDTELYERVARLERTVSELQRAVERLHAGSSSRTDTSATEQTTASSPATPAFLDAPADTSATALPSPSFQLPDEIYTTEYWLNKIGMGLLLFGLAFLFKYAVDQGWLTPAVRVGIGLSIGTVLLLIGIRIHRKRGAFSQVLFGGSVASYYITGFAAFQLYDLVPHPVAFAFMVAVTVLAFALSVWQGQVVLALIGTIGGLATPFLLYTGEGSTAGLIAYTCLVLAGIVAIYFYHEWRSLLWLATLGGWIVFGIALESLPADTTQAIGDRWAIQAGIVFAWLAFWAVPLAREVLVRMQPDRWKRDSADEQAFLARLRRLSDRHVHVLSVTTPLLALLFTAVTWELTEQPAGLVAFSGSVVYGIVAFLLARRGDACGLAFAQAVAATALLTAALILLLDGDVLLFALAVQAAALHAIAFRLDDGGTAVLGHILSVIVAFWVLGRLLDGEAEGRLLLNAPALTDLAVLALLAASSFIIGTPGLDWVYRLLAYGALLAWFVRELAPLPNGGGYATLAWGVCGAALLLIGLMEDRLSLRRLGIGTLLLVVGKLFLVDLSELDALWRILLFLGFGGLFLVISYYFQSLWRPAMREQGAE